MTDLWGDHERRAREAWRRAERLGAFLEVGRTVRVGDEIVEVVATLADATQTVVAYRAPAGSDLFPSPVDPPGGASGGAMGDLLVAHLPPAEGSTVLVNFGDFDNDDHEVELPIDRVRTRPHERQPGGPHVAFMADGARVAILGAAVGLLMATIDLEVSSDDRAIVAATLGARGFLPHPHRHACSGALWRDWFPPAEPLPGDQPTGDEEIGGQGPPGSSRELLRTRLGASATATARFTAVPEGQQSPPPVPPPRPWKVRTLPDRQGLAAQGWSTGGGPVPETLSMGTTLRFDPPHDDVSALELVLDELFIFRRCSDELVEVPGPRSDESLDLSGRSLACGSERIDLVRWEKSEQGNPDLVVRPSHPGLWPDIRVVRGNASVSLCLRPDAGEELAGGLPGMYNPLFPAGGQVILGMRMLGRKATVPPFTIPLAPVDTSSS